MDVLFKKGLKENLPPLSQDGVFYITEDTKEIFLGLNGNIEQLSKNIVISDSEPINAEVGTLWIDISEESGSGSSSGGSSSLISLDTTLTQEGMAADAKAVGDALSEKQPTGDYALKSDIPEESPLTYSKQYNLYTFYENTFVANKNTFMFGGFDGKHLWSITGQEIIVNFNGESYNTTCTAEGEYYTIVFGDHTIREHVTGSNGTVLSNLVKGETYTFSIEVNEAQVLLNDKHLSSSIARTADIPRELSSLDNDVGYITDYTETDPTVPAWAKAANKPIYTAAEIGIETTTEVTADSTALVTSGAVATYVTEQLSAIIDYEEVAF